MIDKEQSILVSLVEKFKLFKEPKNIGEIIDYNNQSYLIIGIERAWFVRDQLNIKYTCQNLNVSNTLTVVKNNQVVKENNYTVFYRKIDTKEYLEQDYWERDSQENILKIGEMFYLEGNYYRWVNYLELKFDFTILEVYGYAEPIYPITTKDARKKLIDNKRRKVGLEVIK